MIVARAQIAVTIELREHSQRSCYPIFWLMRELTAGLPTSSENTNALMRDRAANAPALGREAPLHREARPLRPRRRADRRPLQPVINFLDFSVHQQGEPGYATTPRINIACQPVAFARIVYNAAANRRSARLPEAVRGR